MKFSLATIAYVFALLAAGMAVFGWLGLVASGMVLAFWTLMLTKPRQTVWIWIGVICFAVLALMLLAPAVASARSAAVRNHCLNNLKQIMLGIEGYRAARGTYPPAYSTDDSGKPLLSWRVLILPYMEMGPLYKQFRLNEPWDGPNNRTLIKEMPDIFACPGVVRCRELGCLYHAELPEHVANYVAVVGEPTAWPPGRARSQAEVSDPPSETVVVLEYSGGATPWTAPDDLTLDEALDLFESGEPQGHIFIEENFFTITTYSKLYLAGMGDTRGIPMPVRIDRDTALSLLTVSGGEDLSQWNPDLHDVQSDEVVQIRWGRIYAAIAFGVLAMLPGVRLRRVKSSEESPAS